MEHTPGLTFALEHAQSFARRQGTDQVDPLHLLLGLLKEEEARPATLLATAGVDAVRVEQSLFAGGQDAGPCEVPLPLSRAVNVMLRQARELARTLSAEGTISTDQVLLTLLREDAGLRGALESLGLDFTRLEESILGPRTSVQFDTSFSLDADPEQVDVGRILDASANRAREALRVLEDYSRFFLSDAFLSRELKTLRHELATALDGLNPALLWNARETQQDVGTSISTERELERSSLAEVATANAKRLQEALRSLEEFGKLIDGPFAVAVESLRYRSYTVEKALLEAARAREQLVGVQLCVLVTDALCRASLPGTVAEALAGGAQMIQLREKQLDDRTLLRLAQEIRRLTRKANALFIVNDRADIARSSEADGVHLGQDDLPVYAARRILGPDALIGVSTHNLEQVRQAVRDGASYIGVGPTFPSSTKEFAELPGLEFVQQAVQETSLPAFAIGGINVENLQEVIATGVRRVAVSGAICRAEDPRRTASLMRGIL